MRKEGHSPSIRPALDAVAAALGALAAAVIGIGGVWWTTTSRLRVEMRESLIQVARAAAAVVDADLHRTITTPAQIDGDDYNRCIAPLRAIYARVVGVKYLYTVVLNGNDVRFVLDTAQPGDNDGDGVEDRSGVWEVYDDADPVMRAVLGGGPAAATDTPYTDKWGTFFTACAPLVDSSGREAGAVGVDMTADTFLAHLAATRRSALLGLVPAVVLCLSAGLVTYRLRRRTLCEADQRRRQEEALRESEERFRSVLAAARDAIVVMGPQGEITLWSPGAEAMFGWAADEAVGKSVHRLLAPPRYHDAHARGFAAFRATGHGPAVGKTLELATLHKDGHEFQVELSLSVLDLNGSWGAVGILRDIRERKQAETALCRERDRVRQYLDIAGVLLVALDKEGEITLLNRKGHEILGYKEGTLIGRNWFETCLPPQVRDETRVIFQKLMTGDVESVEHVENPVLTSTGEERIVAWHNVLLTDESGRIVGTLSSGEDVTERKWTEERIQTFARHETIVNALLRIGLQDRPLRELLECCLDELLSTDWLLARRSGIFLIEDKPDVLVLRAQRNLAPPTQELCACLPVGHRLCGRAALSGVVEFVGCVDERHEVRYEGMSADAHYCVPICSGREVLGVLVLYLPEEQERNKSEEEEFLEVVGGTLAGIIKRKRAEEDLQTAARTDKLTGLPNRALLCDRLQQAILRAQRLENYQFAVLFLDFDRFKIINDSLGHKIGDMLLQEAGVRLRAAVRASDSLSRHASGHTTARLGGDEFVVLLDGLRGPEDARLVADRLLEALSQPYRLGEHEVYCTASIGIVTSDMAAASADGVLRDADTAMYEAKLAGKGRSVVFDTSMRQRVQNRLSLENDLRKALEANQLLLMYQPIVSLETKEIEGFEALVHWQHPERGLISPAEFLPIAEDTGLIGPIGEWALKEACRQFAEWRQTQNHAVPRSISVNLSRSQLLLANLPTMIRRILEETGLPPSSLHLETSESVIMRDADLAMRILPRLKEIGVKLGMDGFGAGHSSLACLHQFPFDVLKIDRSFIANVDRGRDLAALVQAVISLARNLDIHVVAEGIETGDQLLTLQSLGCQCGQGDFFSKPMTAAEVPGFRVHPIVLPGTVSPEARPLPAGEGGASVSRSAVD
jgi:diguanylate cyclase (GGDEF)-like protein/PAS domain S-box-containing protein